MPGIELLFFGYPVGGLIMILKKKSRILRGKEIHPNIQVTLSDVVAVYRRNQSKGSQPVS